MPCLVYKRCMTNPVKKTKVSPALEGTDVGQLQILIQTQTFVTDSARFRVDPEGNRVTITDTLTRKKVKVPLFAARETLEALEALFG
jgi:hypothetical protein